MYGMLRRMPSSLFQEWKAFEKIEPFPGERADFNTAHIVQFIWSLAGDAKQYPNGRPLSDFLLPFGDSKARTHRVAVQTVQHQERLLETWIIGNNLIHEKAAQLKGQ